MKKILLAVLAAAACAVPSYGGGAGPDALAGSPVYSDPVFQDYMETAYGYLNPASRFKPAPVFRDAVASPAAPGPRVFLVITPSTRDLPGLLKALSAAGFSFAGEKTTYSRSGKVTRLLGRASPDAVRAIRGLRGVASVRIGRGKRAGKPRAARAG